MAKWKHGRFNKMEEPEDYEAQHKMNIVLFDYETIDKIVNECEPHAKASEFQVHYNSLQAHITKGDYEVCITVPLSFYNFEQEVTSGSVSMEMKDVNKYAELASKLNQDKMQEVFKELPIMEHIQALGFDVEYTVSNNGSIHRHPGDFSFSSIDYDKDPEEPGVIYRQMRATDLYQTDSVIYLGEDEPKFVCTETRIVNVEPVPNNGGIKGTYTEIPTLSFITKKPVLRNRMYDILGEEFKEESISLLEQFKTTKSMKMSLKEYPLLVEVLKAFLETLYRPDVTFVDGKHITQEKRTYKPVNYYGKKKLGTSTTTETQSTSKSMDVHKKNSTNTTDKDDYIDNGWEQLVDEYEDEPETMFIAGKMMVWNEEYASWLPEKTAKMNEVELINYLDEQGYC